MATNGFPSPLPTTLRQRIAAVFAPSAAPEEEEHVRKKPANLVYDVDDVPPLAVRLGVSLQHIFLMSRGWLYIAVIVNAVGGGKYEAESLIKMSSSNSWFVLE
jgi:hypothetical protein